MYANIFQVVPEPWGSFSLPSIVLMGTVRNYATISHLLQPSATLVTWPVGGNWHPPGYAGLIRHG